MNVSDQINLNHWEFLLINSLVIDLYVIKGALVTKAVEGAATPPSLAPYVYSPLIL